MMRWSSRLQERVLRESDSRIRSRMLVNRVPVSYPPEYNAGRRGFYREVEPW